MEEFTYYKEVINVHLSILKGKRGCLTKTSESYNRYEIKGSISEHCRGSRTTLEFKLIASRKSTDQVFMRELSSIIRKELETHGYKLHNKNK